MFSPQQDVELGKRVAAGAEKQLPLCNAPKVDAYLTQLGTRLASKLPTGGVQYPFEFHCVNDKAKPNARQRTTFPVATNWRGI